MADPLVVLRAGMSARVLAKIIDALTEEYPDAVVRGAESVEIRRGADERYLLLGPVVVEDGVLAMPTWGDS